ncbi:MAG: hypothetical protein GXC73_00450, partial [Chitinophagaceae bacterium]|nr:hypothetical protein [Chitinophagaceae bacterium]
FLLQFFQGAGIALFFTSALSQFLKRFPISQLAFVFISSAFLLWITGYVCNKLEHRLPVKKLSITLTLIIAVSMFFFWIGPLFITQDWFYYLMLAWFNVLYLINNLEFWGLAAQLYDVRQSKRLFAVISSGDIPAKFIGYTFALLIVPYIGSQNLLLAGLLAVLISLLFISKVFSTNAWSKPGVHHHKSKQHHTVGIKALWKNFSSNKLILYSALVSVAAFTGFVLVEYAFYAEIKDSKSYKTDEAFAAFIAMFMGCARLFAWILKLSLTSRLISWIGNRNALLITPVVLLFFNVIILSSQSFGLQKTAVLYIFGAAAVLVDALRASINSPVLLIILQPLPTPERLRAHNIIKGVMDPFALLTIGLLLFILYNSNSYQLSTLSWVLIAVSVAWCIAVVVVQREYIKTLISAISSRYFYRDEIKVTDKKTLDRIADKLQTGTELEAMYLLKLLEDDDARTAMVEKALAHSSEKVNNSALDLIAAKQQKESAAAVQKLIYETSSTSVKAKAIIVLSAIQYDHDLLASFLTDDHEQIQQAAIAGLLQYSTSADDREKALQVLKNWVHSTGKKQRLLAAQLPAKCGEKFPEQFISVLLNDREIEIVAVTIQSIGVSGQAQLLPQLEPQFADYPKLVTEAFYNAGEESLPYIHQLLHQHLSTQQQQLLISTCGRIGTKAAEKFLFRLLEELPLQTPVIIKALNRMNFSAGEEHRTVIDQLTNNQLLRAVELLFMLNRLHSRQKSNNPVMYNSLHLELMEARETILNLFSFYSEKEQVDKIKKALLLNQKETAANALELIEITIRKDFAFTFNTVFEDADIAFRCSLLKKVMPGALYESIEEVVTRILKQQEDEFNHWTKACSLHSIRQDALRVTDTILRPYLQSKNRLLQETAVYAASS